MEQVDSLRYYKTVVSWIIQVIYWNQDICGGQYLQLRWKDHMKMDFRMVGHKDEMQHHWNARDFLFWSRSYGSVYKALHKESGQVLAIKQVPVDTDLQEIIKEISIMQQCDSPWVVKYYGSYFKNTDLWVS